MDFRYSGSVQEGDNNRHDAPKAFVHGIPTSITVTHNLKLDEMKLSRPKELRKMAPTFSGLATRSRMTMSLDEVSSFFESSMQCLIVI